LITRKILLFVLGVFYLLILFFQVSPVNADNKNQTEEPFIFPYSGNYYITKGCHSDGWGEYYTKGSTVTCAIDFTKYGDSRKVGCGEPAVAPVSGEFINLGTDLQKNTLGLLKGTRYWTLWFHGDFVNSGYLNQGEVFGYEANNGYSSGCHWHMDVYDTYTNQWVDPRDVSTMNLVSVLPEGARTDIIPESNDPLIEVLKKISIETKSTIVYEDILPTATTEVISTPEVAPKEIQIEETQTTNFDKDKIIDEFVKTWAVLIGFFLGLGLIAFSGNDYGSKGTGFIILVITVAFGIRFYNQGVEPRFKLPKEGESIPITSTPTISPTPERETVKPSEDRQTEFVVTNVSLSQLPSVDNSPENIAPQRTVSAPISGDCAINPRWPDSIQQWCIPITFYSRQNNIDPDRYAALMVQESWGNPNALSSTCAFGLGQVMPSDGKGFILTNSDDEQYFQCDLENGTFEAYKKYYDNGRGGYFFENRATIADMKADPNYAIESGTSIYGQYFHNNGNSDWNAAYYYGGPGYGDRYRTILASNFDCVVNQNTSSCSSGTPGIESKIRK
jgi:hypothetical protein